MSEETKEFLKTPRGKAIIQLGLYFVFFVLLAVFFHTNNSRTSYVEKTPLEKYREMNNYAYSYLYNDVSYEGKVFNGKMYFTLNDVDYYYDNVIYETTKDLTMSLSNLDKLYYVNTKDVFSYIEKGNIIAKTEDYETGSLITKYHDDIDNLYVETYEKDKLIYKVILTLEDAKIEITYSNVGLIVDPIR